MGITDKLIEFNHTKKGKIITWCLVGVGTLVMIIGMIMTMVIPPGITAKDLTLAVEHGLTENQYGGYDLLVYDPVTEIMVQPDPINATDTVSFTVMDNSKSFKVTPRIPANGVATLTLQKDQNGLYIIDTSPTRINVRSGEALVSIEVMIDPQKMNVVASLQKKQNNIWIDATEINQTAFFKGTDNQYRIFASITFYDEVNPRATTLTDPRWFEFFCIDELAGDIATAWSATPNNPNSDNLTFSFNASLDFTETYQVTVNYIMDTNNDGNADADDVRISTKVPLEIKLSV